MMPGGLDVGIRHRLTHCVHVCVCFFFFECACVSMCE